jgi:hypothetical protein
MALHDSAPTHDFTLTRNEYSRISPQSFEGNDAGRRTQCTSRGKKLSTSDNEIYYHDIKIFGPIQKHLGATIVIMGLLYPHEVRIRPIRPRTAHHEDSYSVRN